MKYRIIWISIFIDKAKEVRGKHSTYVGLYSMGLADKTFLYFIRSGTLLYRVQRMLSKNNILNNCSEWASLEIQLPQIVTVSIIGQTIRNLIGFTVFINFLLTFPNMSWKVRKVTALNRVFFCICISLDIRYETNCRKTNW